MSATRHGLQIAIPIVAVVFFLAGTLSGVAVNTAFGFDESVYAILPRHWASGEPASGWGLHRPPLLSILGVVPNLLSSPPEWAFRLIGVAFGLAAVLAAWQLGRSAFDRSTATVAIVAIASAAPLQIESGVFLTDVPSSCLLLLTTVLMLRGLHSGGVVRGFAWAALVAASAFYMRYGSIVALLAIGLAALITWRREPGVARGIVVATTLCVVLLLPHFALATLELGRPWSIIAMAGGAAAESDVIPALEYLRWFPWALLGPVAAVLAALGVLSIGATWIGLYKRDRPMTRTEQIRSFLGICVLIQVVIFGLLIHAETRYVLFPMILLVLVGAESATNAGRRFRSEPRLTVAGTLLVVPALSLGVLVTSWELNQRALHWNWTREVGQYIGDQTEGECSVVAADVPIVSWYSGCEALTFAHDARAGLDREGDFVVVREDGHLQPTPDVIQQRYLSRATGEVVFENGFGDAVASVFGIER